MEGFKAKFGNKMIPFSEFPDEAIRDLREYQLAMIEIKLDEETNLDEIINLFVDINQKGAKVTRLQIVRAIKRDDLFLKSVYALIAEKQPRYHDIFTKVKKGTVSGVLGKLSVVKGAADKNAQADRMWGKLMEFALFIRNGNKHGKGSDVLKKFVEKAEEHELNSEERKRLRRVFTFLNSAYKNTALSDSRLASDYSHFYIMTTALLSGLLPNDADEPARIALAKQLIKFGSMLDERAGKPIEDEETDTDKYLTLSSKQTTDASKREQRQKLFEKIVKKL
jgi:hypothetical protein